MHVLFVHRSFPAQFGHMAGWLAGREDCECTFLSELPGDSLPGIRRLRYDAPGQPAEGTHWAAADFENAVRRAHAVYETLKLHPDVRPDLVVGHSGFGSTLFLAELYDCPIVSYCEFYYTGRGSDLDFRPEFPPDEIDVLRTRARNAMPLLDLQTCHAGYTPTRWQHSLLPAEYRPKIEVLHDGIDARFWQRRPAPRQIGNRTIPPDTRIVTYVARGFESLRGFDVFMKVAKRLCDLRRDVLFVCVGSDEVCYGGDRRYIPERSFREHVLAQDDYDLTRFIFTGLVDPYRLSEILSLSDLHVYLTAPFVLSWSLLNALSCGCVVLASDTPPVQEIIEHERHGLLAGFFDVEGFVEAACRVLDDPEKFRPLGEAGARLVRDQYALDRALPELFDFFHRTILEQRQPADTAGSAPVHIHVREEPRLLIEALVDGTVCERVRVAEPHRVLEKLPGVRTRTVRRLADIDWDAPEPERVFVWQRVFLPPGDHRVFGVLRELIRRDVLLVSEFDDHPGLFDDLVAARGLQFRACHCVQTTTEPLAAALREYNPHVGVIPNQLPWLPALRPSRDRPGARLFYGAQNRERDWAPLMPALNRVCREFGRRLRFEVVHDRAFFDALEHRAKRWTPFCDYYRYQKVLRSCDIALLPLEDTAFNRAKSDLKYLECAGHGVAALASHTVYADSICDGETGLIFGTPTEFETRLRSLIEDRPQRLRLVENAHLRIAARRLQRQHAPDRLAWYRDLRAQLPRLTQDLYDRTPELC